MTLEIGSCSPQSPRSQVEWAKFLSSGEGGRMQSVEKGRIGWQYPGSSFWEVETKVPMLSVFFLPNLFRPG